MSKFIVLSEIKAAAEVAEWWDLQHTVTEEVKIFDSFEEAKTEMRKAVKRLVQKCEFFPFENGRYVPVEEFDDGDEDEDILLLGKIISNSIKKPEYYYNAAESLDINWTDDGDHSFAFVGREDFILVDYYGKKLSMNIHNMEEPGSYFFTYEEEDEDEGRTLNSISIRLISTEKKRKKAAKKKTSASEKKTSDYETVSFGCYVRDSGGKVLSPITWRVLEKKDGMALLISEKVIDHVQFSSRGSNNWDESDLRNWLNADFFDRAFDDEEKMLISEMKSGEKVSLMSIDDYVKYFSTYNDAKAEYTDYCRSVTGRDYGTKIRDPYAFWWLRTPNTEGGWGNDGNYYVHHVCGDGTVNPFEAASYSDGVRPVIWVRAEALI